MRIAVFVLACLLFASFQIHGQQQVLQLEKYGSPKVIRFFEGDELFIKIKEEKNKWIPVIVEDIPEESEIIRFDIGLVRLDEIRAIKTLSQSNAAQFVKTKLLFFGAGLVLLSPLDLIVGLPYNTALGLYVGGGAVASAFLFKWILDATLKHKIGKRKWLRVLTLPYDYIPVPG